MRKSRVSQKHPSDNKIPSPQFPVPLVLAQPADDPPILTAAQAAKRCGLSLGALKKMRATGQGPAFVRYGEGVRYWTKSVDDWIKRKAVGDQVNKAQSISG